jgi:ABC-type lipoprotein release transport system permease subunit
MIINLNINHNYIKIILKFVSAYLKDIFQKRKEILLCFVSISALTIAIIVLILGFTLFSATQKTILNSLQGIQPDLTLQIPHQEDIDLIEKKINKLGLATAKTRWDYGAIVEDNEILSILLIKTINPKLEKLVCAIEKTCFPTCSLNLINEPMSALVGKTLFLENVIDHKLTICIPDKNGLVPTTLNVKGFVQTGFEEIDQSLIIINEHTSDWLFGKDSDLLEIKTPTNKTDLKKLVNKIYSETGLIAKSWQDLYPALAIGINIQALTTNIIAFLISLLSLSTMLLAFYALLYDKRRNINILLKQGLPKKIIIIIDLIILALIIFTAVLLSIIISGFIIYILALNIEKYMGLENQLNYIYLFKIPVFCSFIAILLAFLLTYFNIQNCAKNKF